MGLDMYAGALRLKPNKVVDFELPDDREELFYWRKHPDLHGWMKQLYRQKGGTDEDFNCVAVLLEEEDLDALEEDLRVANLPPTRGCFFGESTDHDVTEDFEFIAKARQAIKHGKSVYYTSWW